MSIGLIAVFREKFNYQSKFVKSLADSSFTVYMFHPPIIVAVALLFRPVALLPIIKWVILHHMCAVMLCSSTLYLPKNTVIEKCFMRQLVRVNFPHLHFVLRMGASG